MKLAIGIISLIIFIFAIYLYSPVLRSEIKYSLDQTLGVRYIPGKTESLNSFEKPLPIPDTDSSIAIPKIGIALPLKNLPDPFENKDIELDFGIEMRLINKLSKGDKILLYYDGRTAEYSIGDIDPAKITNNLTLKSSYLPEPFTKTITITATSLLTSY